MKKQKLSEFTADTLVAKKNTLLSSKSVHQLVDMIFKLQEENERLQADCNEKRKDLQKLAKVCRKYLPNK